MRSTEAATGVASPDHKLASVFDTRSPGVFISIQEVKDLTNWLKHYRPALRIVQIVIAIVMLLLALDWALGDGSQRAWLALLGIVLTALQLVNRRDCE